MFTLIKQAEQVRAKPRWVPKTGAETPPEDRANPSRARSSRRTGRGGGLFQDRRKRAISPNRDTATKPGGQMAESELNQKGGKKGAALRRRSGVERTAAFEELAFEMDWQLAMSDRFYKIEDVVIDGVSMALTHRSEIVSMIARNGGRLEALLATMRQES